MIKKIKRKFTPQLQRVRRLDYILYYLFYRFTNKVNPKQILILSESRQELSGNLKYIDEKIDKQKYKVIYSFKKSILQKRTQSEVRELCKCLAKSKYILVDDFIPVMYPIPLRKET